MTTFTMRYIKGHFVVTGPDIPPMQFKSRAEARDWCKEHYPGSPVMGMSDFRSAARVWKLRPAASPPSCW